MRADSLAHLSDVDLLQNLATIVALDRVTTAEMLACLGEVDARKLYVPAGYSSLFVYCVEELRFSEDAAYKRIQAARAARRFPALLAALADGRLHLTAAGLLAPHLTPENVEELLAAASHQRKIEVEMLLAERFGRIEARSLAATIRPLPNRQLAPAQVGSLTSGQLELAPAQVVSGLPEPIELAPAQVQPGLPEQERLAPAQVGSVAPGIEPLAPAQVALSVPRSPERYELRVTIGREVHERLQYARALLSHAMPSGDVAEVLNRALQSLIKRLEKQKFAAAEKPRAGRLATRARAIPAEVRRMVWRRDGGRCTFVGETGHRCAARRFLEFDHIEPVAHGGVATAENLRLRCRAHNQHEAERAFGTDFMKKKREAASPDTFKVEDP